MGTKFEVNFREIFLTRNPDGKSVTLIDLNANDLAANEYHIISWQLFSIYYRLLT